jgi:hypothetical protein
LMESSNGSIKMRSGLFNEIEPVFALMLILASQVNLNATGSNANWYPPRLKML